MGSLYNSKEQFLHAVNILASRLNSRNCPVFWESERNIDFVHTFLKRKRDVDNDQNPELTEWIEKFDRDKVEGAKEFWYETLKGIDENLLELY
jgi:glyceraldehyde-3-phosphate dehydrogenase (ferredoxin)